MPDTLDMQLQQAEDAKLIEEQRRKIGDLETALIKMLRAFSCLGVELGNEGTPEQQKADHAARTALGMEIRT